MNTIMIDGRVMKNTENAPHNYMFNASNGEKKSFLRMTISSTKPGSKKDEKTGYYPTDFWTVKAFGQTAEFINQYFGPGSRVVVSGEITMSEPYTAPETGKEYPARPEIIASRVWIADAPSNTTESGSTGGVTQKQTNARPAAPIRQAARRDLPF